MAKVTSGRTPVKPGSSNNWSCCVYWERESVDVANLTCTIKAQIELYYYSSELGSRTGTITINNTSQNVTIPSHRDYPGSTEYKCRQKSNFVNFTVPITSEGECTINVKCSQTINAYRNSSGTYVGTIYSPSSNSTTQFELETVETYSRAYDQNGNKNKFFYKTTDGGNTWTKCNAYKTTDGGNTWTKII